MTSSTQKLVVVVLLALNSLAATPAWASITRVAGPAVLFQEPRMFVKLDVAYDSVNQVYLVVWGTQANGPVNGLFLNRAGSPVSGIFPVSDGPEQSGWARVTYSAQANRFLVAYTKILAPGVHLRIAKFVRWSNGPSMPWPEIPIDALGGNPGTDSGVAYSPAAGRFLVTWWKPNGAYPASWMSTVDPNTNLASPPVLISDPADAQSDPEITCDPTTNRCLAVGWSWGLTNGNLNSVWGRLIDGTTGNPIGNAFIIDGSPLESEPTVGVASGQFVVVFVRNFSSVWSIPVSPTGAVGTARPVAQSAGEASPDGGGYGTINISGNPGTGTLALTMLTWSSYPAVQELAANGAAISGAFDIVPNAGPDYNRRSKETAAASDPGGSFLILDNDRFVAGRGTRYAAGGTPPPAPTPPPPTQPNTLMSLDIPVSGSAASGQVTVAGWAIDLSAPSGPGVDTVHVYAFRVGGGSPIFMGAASPMSRPDVGAAFGDGRFASGGFNMTAPLPPGTYDVAAYAHSTVSGTFTAVRSARVTVLAVAGDPYMSVDTPTPGQSVPKLSTTFAIGGWALDRASPSGSGVDAVHVWAYPVAGGSPFWVGQATFGVQRPDVAAAFGPQFLNAGFSGVVGIPSSVPAGAYDLVVWAHSSIGGWTNWSVIRVVVP